MDCVALRSDIDKLKQELQIFEASIDAAREADGHGEELRGVAELLDSDLSDSVLKKYLEDLQEQNIDIIFGATLGERIDIENAWGHSASVSSIAVTDDGDVLIGGFGGVLYAGSFDGRGGLDLGDRIDVRSPEYIYTIAIAAGGRVLMGGGDGTFRDGLYDKQGKTIIPGEKIDIKEAHELPTSINSIAVTKDGRVLIGGDGGAFYIGSYDNQGKLVLGDRIDILQADNTPANIRSIVVTEDGRVLIGGDDGVFYAGSYDSHGGLTLGNLISIRDVEGRPARINAIAVINVRL